MTGTSHLALANLTSPTVLACLLGLLVLVTRSPLRVPAPVIEVLSNRLLLAIGLIAGPRGYEKVEPYFGELLLGFLAIFLSQLGIQGGESLKASRRIGHLRTSDLMDKERIRAD